VLEGILSLAEGAESGAAFKATASR
jgi:hypothetical protein